MGTGSLSDSLNGILSNPLKLLDPRFYGRVALRPIKKVWWRIRATFFGRGCRFGLSLFFDLIDGQSFDFIFHKIRAFVLAAQGRFEDAVLSYGPKVDQIRLKDAFTFSYLLSWAHKSSDLVCNQIMELWLHRIKSRPEDPKFVLEHVEALLNQGRLDNSLALLRATCAAQDKNMNGFFLRLFEEVQRLKIEAYERANERRATSSGHIVIGSVVWGEKYVSNYLNFFLRSILAPGNLPALSDRKVILSILTTEKGQTQIQAHTVYQELRKYCQIEFFLFPESLVSNLNEIKPDQVFYRIYGALDHTNIFFAEALDADLFLLPVDSIVADNSLKNMDRLIEKDFDCCGSANIVASQDSFLSTLDAKFRGSKEIAISNKNLATLAFQHRHQYIESQLVMKSNEDFGRWPRELFWPQKDIVFAHSMYVHPLAISRRLLRKRPRVTFNNVDAAYVGRLFQNPLDFDRLKILTASDEAYLTNFVAAGRRFETTGSPFQTRLFIEAHRYSEPVHRYIFRHRQEIPCDTGLEQTPTPEACAGEVKIILQTMSRVWKYGKYQVRPAGRI